MNRDEAKKTITEMGTLVAELAEILDSQENDPALAFLEVCQDVQHSLSRLLHGVMAPILLNQGSSGAGPVTVTAYNE